MKALVDAIVQRFNSDKTLKRFARRIHEGLGTEAVKSVPYVDVTITGPSAELDTFDADIETFEVTFTLFGKDSIPNNLHRALTEMKRVFDDCDLISGDFTGVQFHRTAGSLPAVVEGNYQASLTYDVIVQMAVMVPVTRAN